MSGRRVALAVAAALLTAVALTGGLIWWGSRGAQPAESPVVRTATGTIVSFAADRASAEIAHDPIEGFMEAMTMRFDFADAKLSSGLREGEKVRFSFTATNDSRLLISRIAREER